MIDINFTNASLIDQTKLILVSFGAPWCSACTAQSRLLENIADFPENILLASINVGENRFLAQKYAVGSIPDLILFSEGRMVKRYGQINNAQQLLHELKQIDQ